MDDLLPRWALSAKKARENGDFRTAEYWDEMIERESLRREIDSHREEWALLKGSPEHG